eukprot:4657979-Pyramimonas_sp.AAC.1
MTKVSGCGSGGTALQKAGTVHSSMPALSNRGIPRNQVVSILVDAMLTNGIGNDLGAQRGTHQSRNGKI